MASPLVLSRRSFIVQSAASFALLAADPALAAVSPAAPADTTSRNPIKPPPLPDALVKEFVGAAHGNLDRTREMLGNEPGLLNATWDWKAGDFETGLGGAGHMGRRDIALYLLDQGARLDLFVAAMLGEMAIVKSILDFKPALASSKGPHGIPLIAHAKAGGEPAAAVLEYLERLAKDGRG
jgi:hypothetical protein